MQVVEAEGGSTAGVSFDRGTSHEDAKVALADLALPLMSLYPELRKSKGGPEVHCGLRVQGHDIPCWQVPLVSLRLQCVPSTQQIPDHHHRV